jgi:phosphate uptake regulator
MDIPTIWKYFMAVYREGYSEVIVKFDPKKEFENPYKFLTQHRLDSNYAKRRDKISPIEALQSFINRFIDFEIVEHGKDYVVIREMGELTGKEFDNSLRRVFFLLQQMTDDLLEAMTKENPKLVAHMHDIDINLDKFHDYCIRILNKVSNKDIKKTSLLFSTLYILELIGDEFKHISTHLVHDYAKTKLTTMIPFMISIKEMITAFYELFYKFSDDKINTISEIDKKVYLSMPTIYKKAGEEEKEIYHHLRMIERYVNALLELRIELEF